MLTRAGTAAAEVPGVLRSAVGVLEMPVPPAPPARSPHAERLMYFDGNADHRISRDELPERMQGLVARGDRNADAALDSSEIRALMVAAESDRVRVSFRPQPSEGLPGVVKDLKLPPAKHAGALAILSAYQLPRTVNHATGSDLYRDMRALLDDQEYGNFTAAAARLSRTPRIIK
jgi:hypothetical protein